MRCARCSLARAVRPGRALAALAKINTSFPCTRPMCALAALCHCLLCLLLLALPRARSCAPFPLTSLQRSSNEQARHRQSKGSESLGATGREVRLAR
eukprot:1340389-Alexandrium_andersonii.AAC.1